MRTGPVPVALVPDPAWWGRKPRLDKIIYWALDGTSTLDAYLNMEIDDTSAVDPEKYQRPKNERGTDIRVGARWDQVTLGLNGGRGPRQEAAGRGGLAGQRRRRAAHQGRQAAAPGVRHARRRRRTLYNQADARIWKLGHSIPLYQRPQIIAVRKGLVNHGAPGLGDEDPKTIGRLK